jgi:hypothetical protein
MNSSDFFGSLEADSKCRKSYGHASTLDEAKAAFRAEH